MTTTNAAKAGLWRRAANPLMSGVGTETGIGLAAGPSFYRGAGPTGAIAARQLLERADVHEPYGLRRVQQLG